jgi:hypothetical protein
MATGADPIAATSEADASGETAALYEDLRVTLGVSFVNLIWRHLATIPGGLAFVWTLVKPLYVSGELDRRSIDAASRVSLPSLAPLPDFVWDSVAITVQDRRTIAALIESYNHANGVNFLALIVALSALRDGLPSIDQSEQPSARHRRSPPIETFPSLPGLSDLSPPVRELVRQFDQLGRLGPSDAIASLYRHLAHWPAFLATAYVALKPHHDSGELAKAQKHVIAFGGEQCPHLMRLAGPDLPFISPASKAAVLRGLEEFTGLMIGRMVVIGKAMRFLISDRHHCCGDIIE